MAIAGMLKGKIHLLLVAAAEAAPLICVPLPDYAASFTTNAGTSARPTPSRAWSMR